MTEQLVRLQVNVTLDQARQLADLINRYKLPISEIVLQQIKDESLTPPPATAGSPVSGDDR